MADVGGYELLGMVYPHCRTPDASKASAPLPQVYKEDDSLLAWPNVLHATPLHPIMKKEIITEFFRSRWSRHGRFLTHYCFANPDLPP